MDNYHAIEIERSNQLWNFMQISQLYFSIYSKNRTVSQMKFLLSLAASTAIDQMVQLCTS